MVQDHQINTAQPRPFEGCVKGSRKGIFRFLKLACTPCLLRSSKNHRFAKAGKLTLQNLNGEYLVMPIEGVSAELDAFRNEIKQNHPTVQIIDSTYCGVDTFTICEVNPYILITQPVYSDIRTRLVTIPPETEYTLPYGLIYSNEPTGATQKLMKAGREFLKTWENMENNIVA